MVNRGVRFLDARDVIGARHETKIYHSGAMQFSSFAAFLTR
jgi:hypothetical protein